MDNLVEHKLGTAASRLYDRIAAKVGELSDAAPRTALAAVGLGVLCGTYHDYRAGWPNPKGDLVEALRAVPTDPSVDAWRDALVFSVLAGEYADGPVEAAKWAASVMPAREEPVVVMAAARHPVDLNPREYRVFVWLYRYVEVYGKGPMVKEMSMSLEMKSIGITDVLRTLATKGAVVRVGGSRGWLPLRAP